MIVDGRLRLRIQAFGLIIGQDKELYIIQKGRGNKKKS